MPHRCETMCSSLLNSLLWARAQRFVGAPRLSARLGESATAYQSPGKDLDIINRSLSGRSIARAALLNTGGLVLQSLDPNSVRCRPLCCPPERSMSGRSDARGVLRGARGLFTWSHGWPVCMQASTAEASSALCRSSSWMYARHVLGWL